MGTMNPSISKNSRFDFRVKPNVKQTIEKACDIIGANVSDFVIMAAYEKAEDLILKHQSFVATENDLLAAIELMENGANDEMKKLMSLLNEN